MKFFRSITLVGWVIIAFVLGIIATQVNFLWHDREREVIRQETLFREYLSSDYPLVENPSVYCTDFNCVSPAIGSGAGTYIRANCSLLLKRCRPVSGGE